MLCIDTDIRLGSNWDARWHWKHPLWVKFAALETQKVALIAERGFF
jgi:hypothetical protein